MNEADGIRLVKWLETWNEVCHTWALLFSAFLSTRSLSPSASWQVKSTVQLPVEDVSAGCSRSSVLIGL